MNKDPRKPYDIGSADAYYLNKAFPRKEIKYNNKIIMSYELTTEEIEEYWKGFNSEQDKKRW